MKDKKRSFWILLIFFGTLTLLGLAYNQMTISDENPMMGLSMGGMMKIHHADQLKPSDLLRPIVEDHGMGEVSGHHQISGLFESAAFLTTITVFLFLPLLLGGSVMLLILWFA